MYTLLVTGDVPGATTYFNPLLQQTIVKCTSGTRPSSPVQGQHIYETDTGDERIWDGSAWISFAGAKVNINSATGQLTASTTNPNLGSSTGFLSQTQWIRLPGNFIYLIWCFGWGATGATAGSGQYSINLPVNAVGANGTGMPEAAGSGMLRDNSAGVVRGCTTYISGSNLAQATGHTPNSASSNNAAFIGDATPWVWAAQDYYAGTILYRASS